MTPSTHLSILHALRDSSTRDDAWDRFHRRYQPTIFNWCVRWGLQPSDAEDVTQTVLTRLFESLPEHRHDPNRPFRGWLRTVVNNAVRDLLRAAQRRPGDRGAGGSQALDQLANLAEPASVDELAEAMERLPDPDLEAAVRRIQARVSEGTWQAFWLLVVNLSQPADVAAQLNMSVRAVYQAKARVSRLLAQEYGGRD